MTKLSQFLPVLYILATVDAAFICPLIDCAECHLHQEHCPLFCASCGERHKSFV